MQHPLKKKEKKALPLRWAVVLLVAVVMALAAVVLVQVLSPAPPSQLYPDPEPVLPYETLQVKDTANLSSITITHLDGESYTLRYQGKALLLENDGQLLDINDSLSATLIETVGTIAVENVVTRDVSEVAEHLPDMGLEPPETTVCIRYTDGTEDVLSIGAGVPHTTYSYFRWSGDNGVYMCDAGIPEIFGYTANQLLPVTQPELQNRLIDRLTIVNACGETELLLAVDALGGITGQLVLPVVYPMAGDAAAAMSTALSNFRLGTRLGDAESLAAECGFDTPLCTVDIHQQEGMYTRINELGELVVETLPAQQLRFVFGKAEGEYFYTCAYEGEAYLVSRFLVEPLIAADPAALMTHHPAELGTWPARIAVETENGSFEVEITRSLRVMENGEPEVNEDEEWVYDTIATLNGEPLSAGQAEQLVSGVRCMSFSGDVPQGWSPGDAAPRWRMSLTGDDGTVRTLTAYRLDAFSDAVAVDGVIRHYCYTEALATALGDLMP